VTTPRLACALCGATDRRHLFDKDGYPIGRCGSCRLVQVDMELERDELKEIYGDKYFTEDVFHDYLGERRIRLESGAGLARMLSGIVPGGRLLDVGSAAGFFLEAASRHYDVTGVELSPFASGYARKEFGLRVLTGDIAEVGLEGERFDVVTLWNTIEHLADPLQAMRAIASLTRPGAALVLSTGDVGGPLARRDLRGWNLMTPPYHLFFFAPRTIDLLLAKAGFHVRRIIYDGVVSAGGPLSSALGRRFTSALGLGNVMTVYAFRTATPPPTRAGLRLFAARYRPLGLTLRGSTSKSPPRQPQQAAVIGDVLRHRHKGVAQPHLGHPPEED
jgi:SAM-dependent methyltransferase